MWMVRAAFATLAVGFVIAAAQGCRSESEDGRDKPGEPSHTTAATKPAPVHIGALTENRRDEPGGSLSKPQTGCVSAFCHNDLQQHAFVHGPVAVGGCEACHMPDQGDHKFPLKRAGDELCAMCHVVLTGKPFVHEPLRQSGCTECHAPHGSSTKYLLMAETQTDLCRRCHPPAADERFKHGPYGAGACNICHLPHEADNAKLTILSGPEHCFRCHQEMHDHIAGVKSPHGPVMQNCTTCHDPHASGFARILRADPAEQCLSCHADVEAAVRTASAPHGAVFTGKQCLNCHDVHGSSHHAMLRGPMMEMCLTCHDQPQQAYDGRTIPEMKTVLTQSKFLHGPIQQGECQACHHAHGSSNQRLLDQYFPTAFYRDFDLTNYALCFSCHEEALVLDKQTTTLTGFRNGDLNLHYVHVHRDEKGRSCKACHEIHGSQLPKHMAETVPFEGGNWALPIGFRATPTGGSCAPGCHQPFEYDRETPVQYRSTERVQP
jgi:predicted CXXCH cytochrome family protein